MLELVARRQKPGSGSILRNLMAGPRVRAAWWREAHQTLSAAGIQMAVTGAHAANAYMPPRNTGDIDFALRLADLDRAGQALAVAGWKFLGNLELYEDLRGTAWRKKSGQELDLIGLPGAWGHEAISLAQNNLLVNGLPTLTRPFVVIMKLISSRPQDTADIGRMLGGASDDELASVRAAVKRHRPSDLEDLNQMIVAGQLEFGVAPPLCRVCKRPLKSAASRAAGVGPECAKKVGQPRR
jgi:hypothetical protein